MSCILFFGYVVVSCASSNPGNRVCVLFVFLSFFSFSFRFLPTFIIFLLYLYLSFITLVKPVRHNTNCLKKKYIPIKKKYILMTWLVQTNKEGAKRSGKA